MISPYLARFVCLSLAAFFAVHSITGLLVYFVTPAALRRTASMPPQRAARFLFCLRLAPLAVAAFAVVALCIPSYLSFEPDAPTEAVGIPCLAAALLCAALCGVSALRTGRALLLSRRSRPLVALTGIVRPRLILSTAVSKALSESQLDAVLRHERAHQASRDNLKRLILTLAPGLLPLFYGFEALDQNWVRLSEWAADDAAAGGSPERSVVLAEALVRVARFASTRQSSPLAVSFVADRGDLSARIDRLLLATSRPEQPEPGTPWLLPALGLTLALSVAVLVLQPATLSSVHEVLELAMR